jgi:mono/diheme cytochrome c family protein/plastocyanin
VTPSTSLRAGPSTEPALSHVEGLARAGLFLIVVGIPLGFGSAWWSLQNSAEVATLHARMSEDGGWNPETLHAAAGQPLRLRLISDDVMHSFAIGRSEAAPIDLPPGEVVETTLIFEQAGTYTYACTRWCGPNHWRMRGVIEVSGEAAEAVEASVPLYVSLGIDIDALHPAASVPAVRPSPNRGQRLADRLPQNFRSRQDFVARPPAEVWQDLRLLPALADLGDGDVWDLVAYLWRSTTTEEALRDGRELFAQNCAACHGENGAGDGVMSGSLPVVASMESVTAAAAAPADFTDPSTMLGASSAMLQGKILRGGMGTGMPYWGPILTEAQLWALTDYLWTFQFGGTG